MMDMPQDNMQNCQCVQEARLPKEPCWRNICPNEFMQMSKDSCYIDMGVFYGYVQSNFMVWWPEPVHINQQKLDDFLSPLLNQLTRDGIQNIEFSFTQLTDIEFLLNGESGTPTDKITDIFKDNYPVGETQKNLFEYFIQSAHDHLIQANLSYGGAIATDKDWTLRGSPDEQAQMLADLMKKYNLNAVDFDIESAAIMQENQVGDVRLFFKTLHSELSQESPARKITITVMGDAGYWAGNVLKPLFSEFDQMFDGVNLMLYSDTQYYLDAYNPTWGMDTWLGYVSNPAQINIGFFDQIAYENPDASAGQHYKVAGLTRGQAAARIFLDMLAELKLSPSQVGSPFWWTNNPTTLSENQVLFDFHTYLNEH
jgi:hypothetical protein